MKSGFDSEKYLHEQSQAILERAGKFDDKLYLEFGGKLLCDFHAARSIGSAVLRPELVRNSMQQKIPCFPSCPT